MSEELTVARRAVDCATARSPILCAAIGALDRTVALTDFERERFVVLLSRSLAQLRRRPTKA